MALDCVPIEHIPGVWHCGSSLESDGVGSSLDSDGVGSRCGA